MRAVRGVDALDDEAFVALFVHYGACLAQFPIVLPGRLNAEIENFLSLVRARGDRLLEVAPRIDAFGLHHLIVVRVEEGIQSLVQLPASRLGLARRGPIEPEGHRGPDAGGVGSGMQPDRTGDRYRRAPKG